MTWFICSIIPGYRTESCSLQRISSIAIWWNVKSSTSSIIINSWEITTANIQKLFRCIHKCAIRKWLISNRSCLKNHSCFTTILSGWNDGWIDIKCHVTCSDWDIVTPSIFSNIISREYKVVEIWTGLKIFLLDCEVTVYDSSTCFKTSLNMVEVVGINTS